MRRLWSLVIVFGAACADQVEPVGEITTCRTETGCACDVDGERVECDAERLEICAELGVGQCWTPPTWCEAECRAPVEDGDDPAIGLCPGGDYDACVDECSIAAPDGNYCVAGYP